MSRLARLLALVVALGCIGACAPTVYVMYASDPEGAALYVNRTKQLVGYTPFTVKYRPSSAFFKGTTCFMAQPSEVRWVSGAYASVAGLNICPQNGPRQQFVFQRPDVPNRELDGEFAVQLAQAQAAQAAAVGADWAAAARPQLQHCISQVIGNQIFTSCY